ILANFPGSSSIKVEKQIDDFQLEARSMQSLGIIVNELLTNIMKYAFNKRGTGTIRVSAGLHNGIANIIVADDGTGVPESVDFENSSGFGLMLVRTLTAQLGGTIKLIRGHGTTVSLDFEA
ncbi:MAG: sensor histidine kinase, partial [Spirochaetes bacterium]|nr:sensor histidine kinase [Spirochaetota bacterium]